MTKAKNTRGMKGKTDRKTRGRTSITGTDAGASTHPDVPQVLRAEANRPVNAGGGKHRGDRRDMSPTYTGNVRHKARGNTGRPDVTTRKR